MHKKFILTILILVCLSGFTNIQKTSAQDGSPELTLSMSRDFGYSSGTGRIQGTFTMKVSGPDDLIRVVFMIDGEQVSEDTQAPFRFQFNTDTYSQSEHSLSAVGYTPDGREISSNEIKVLFVPAEEGGKLVLTIIVPLFAVIFGLMALSYLVPIITKRGKRNEIPRGQPRTYGLAGGTICPRCKRPYSLNFLAPNLLLGKLDHCPHCGKWALVQRQPQDLLRAAEAAELSNIESDGLQPKLSTEEEKIQKALDDSRFQDL